VGFRIGVGYDWSYNEVDPRKFFSEWNNYYDVRGLKDDADPTQNAARIGCWALMWQVGAGSNVVGSIASVGSATDLPGEFLSINGIDPESSQTISWTRYSDRRSNFNTNSNGRGNGGGDYHYTKTSPCANTAFRRMFPYDLDGKQALVPFHGPFIMRGSYITGAGASKVSGAGAAKPR